MPLGQSSPAAPMHRPHTLADWRRDGLDYAVDKAIDVGAVLLAVFVAWLFVRLLSRRIERWSDEGIDRPRNAREQRARTAAKLVRNIGRAVLTVVAVLMILNQLDVNISPPLASAGVAARAVPSASPRPGRAS